MKVEQLITIKLDAKERELLVHFIERNVEAGDNFDDNKMSDVENRDANDFARKVAYMIQ